MAKAMYKDQLLLLLLLLLLLHLSFSVAIENNQCTASCGEVANISFPFRLRGYPKSCGHPKYELAYINNHTILDLNSGKYLVRSINYTFRTIKVADVGLQKGNCTSLPRHSLSLSYFHFELYWYGCQDGWRYAQINSMTVSIVGCMKAIYSRLYIDTSPCLDGLQFPNISSMRRRLYAMVDANVSSVETGCAIEFMAMIPEGIDGNDLRSYAQIHEQMVYGFELSWCFPERANKVNIGIIIEVLLGIIWQILPLYPPARNIVAFMVGKFIFAAPCVMTLLLRIWGRRHLAMDQNIEEFLQSNNNFLPIWYSYSDIKKITGRLKDKLGEGGYGSVFKGRLRSGREVAVKILKKGKGNGQDFISEVATIGRIYHVNVVGLVGFCFDGSKQALVYDFMHNGSLDKHIFSRGQGTILDCKEVYKIALGVARGIEYLHQGCDIQILHFDIKPHNILLDRDFNPKISDFGLAKLYPTDYNTISMTKARGTWGYMAPELVYRELGGISYKADVYSFGQLLMEMASGRKNLDADVEHSSQIYFSLWVHDQLNEGLDVLMEQASEEDRRIVKKMIIVALWCIQLNPSDRPSMRKVLELLEGEVDDLQMPPGPLFYPTEMSTRDDGTWIDKGNDTISTPSTSAITYEDSHLEYISTSITQAHTCINTI